MTSRAEIRKAIYNLGIGGNPVCVHCSFRSFAGLGGGPERLVDEFLANGCTVMGLALSFAFAANPPAHRHLERNGLDYSVPFHQERVA